MLPRELGDAPDIRCGDAPDIAEVGVFPCCFDTPLAFLLCMLSCSFAQRAEFALLDPTAPTDIAFSFFPNASLTLRSVATYYLEYRLYGEKLESLINPPTMSYEKERLKLCGRKTS